MTWILSPMGIITFLLILLLFRFNKKILGTLILFVFLISNLPIANYFLKKLENNDGNNNQLNFENVDYLIILGGGRTHLIKGKDNNDILVDYSGRYLEGIKIFNKYNFKKIIISKLKLNWDKEFDDQYLDLIKFFTNNDIKRSDILVLNDPVNTNNEANKLIELIGKQKIIIVTSAYHAKRSKIIFQQKGFDPQVYKVNYQTKSGNQLNNFLNYLPNPQAIIMNNLLFKELVGIFYYSIIK